MTCNHKRAIAMCLGLLLVISGGRRTSYADETVCSFTPAGGTAKALKGTVEKKVAISEQQSKDGKAPKMTFTGEGRIEIADSALNFSGSFTIECDLQFESSAGNPYLLSKRSRDTSEIASGYWLEFNDGQFLDFTAAGATSRAALTPEGKKVYHVVAVHKDLGDGKGINLLFIDGQQKGTGEGIGVAAPNDSPLTLGDYVNGFHEFHGTISGLSVSASAVMPVGALGTLPAGAKSAGDVQAIPDDVIGERDTLAKLIKRVESMLTERKLIHDAARRELVSITEKTNAATNLEAVTTQRKLLGKLVGSIASKAYGDVDFILWTQNRWSDLNAHDWPAETLTSAIELNVMMAGDAYASQAVVITNTRGDTTNVEVAIPGNGESTPRIMVRRAWQMACPDLAYRPDPLALADSGKITLQPGETTLLWFEIASHHVKPGKYSLPISVRSTNGNGEVKLNIDVADVKMPEVLDCTLFNYSYLTEMGFIRPLKDEALEDLRRHYINTFVIPGGLPDATADENGNLTGPLDFTPSDRQLELYGKYARQYAFFWGGDYNRHLELFTNLKFLSEPWKKAVTSYYKAWIAHLAEKGLTPKQYVMYVYDERSSPEVQQVYALLKAAAPEVRLLLNPTTGYKRDELEKIADYVNVWQPSYEALLKPHPEDYEFLKSTGEELWVYSCANGTPMPTYDYNLRRHWVAWDLGMTGVAQWAYADHGGWESDNSWKFVRGAFAMVYAKPHAPAELALTEAITPSRRWEAWREGAQDYQLLNMARAKTEKSPPQASELKQAVADVIGHPEDADAADRSRAKLLAILSSKK